ncbi:universal stress protein [Nonomuraea sp. NPDC050022]|uniref:universal stress protein n=1 Tax=Nonomuraea sp. NPDC050022 TaxID=3364358 RepID=UPI0037A96BA7
MAKPIVAGTDGSAPAIAAVEWAAADARRRKLALRVVHVCEQLLFSMEKTQYCAGALEAAADKARALAPDIEVSTELLTENVIVLGPRGRANRRRPPAVHRLTDYSLFGHTRYQQPTLNGRLHWASTETATGYAGHVEGALAAGERAARAILTALSAPAANTPGHGQTAALITRR